jgi:hypothetical protein
MKRKKKMENRWEKICKEDVLNEFKNLLKRNNDLGIMVTMK